MSDTGTQPSVHGRAVRVGGFAIFFSAAVLLCLVRGAWQLPLLSDNQHYFFIAERAAAGVPPHVSQFDPKHALSGLMSALAIKAGRPLGISDVHSARALSIAVTATAVGMAWLLALNLTADVLAAALAAMIMMSVGGFVLMGSMGCRPKVFLALFVLLTLHAFAAGRYKQSGLFAAGSFLCWQPGLVMVACALPTLAVWPDGRRALLGFTVSAAAAVAAYHAYFLYHGALGVQLEQAYLLPAKYSSYHMPNLWRAGRWVLKLRGGFGMGSVAPLLFISGLTAVWVAVLVRPGRLLERVRAQPGWLYFLICAHVVLIFTLVEHQGAPDLFFLLPFIAVGAAATVSWIATGLAAVVAAWASPAVTALTLTVFVALVASTSIKPFKVPFKLDDQHTLGRRLAAYLEDGSSMYAVGCTHLLAFNHVNNHVHYGYFFKRINRYVRDHNDGPYRPLSDGRPPDYIIKSRWFVPHSLPWLKREYRKVDVQHARRQHVSLWRRIKQ